MRRTADGGLMARGDIGREGDSILSLTLIKCNFVDVGYCVGKIVAQQVAVLSHLRIVPRSRRMVAITPSSRWNAQSPIRGQAPVEAGRGHCDAASPPWCNRRILGARRIVTDLAGCPTPTPQGRPTARSLTEDAATP